MDLWRHCKLHGRMKAWLQPPAESCSNTSLTKKKIMTKAENSKPFHPLTPHFSVHQVAVMFPQSLGNLPESPCSFLLFSSSSAPPRLQISNQQNWNQTLSYCFLLWLSGCFFRLLYCQCPFITAVQQERRVTVLVYHYRNSYWFTYLSFISVLC